MRKRGIGSIVAAIFLVLLVGISMSAFISIYNEYKNFALIESQMNEWENQKRMESLVKVTTQEGGGGTVQYTINRTFFVSKEELLYGSISSSDRITTTTPRFYQYDDVDNNYVVLYSEYISWVQARMEAVYTFYINEFSVYNGENWQFELEITYKTYPFWTPSIQVFVYNPTTSNYDLVTILTTSELFVTQEIQISPQYVFNNQIKIKLLMYGGLFFYYLYIDELKLNARYTYSQQMDYDTFVPTAIEGASSSNLPKFQSRDGNPYRSQGDFNIVLNITDLSSIGTLRDLVGFITAGVYYNSHTYDVTVYAYNFTSSSWDQKNATTIDPNEEVRIRVPLGLDYISSDGKVMLNMTGDAPSYSDQILIDEAIVEATWLTGGGGGGGGATTLVIKNESPYTVRIVRIWYINSTGYYIYDPSNSIALKPGETVDLADYHSLSGVTLVKVVTDYGNIFAFSP